MEWSEFIVTVNGERKTSSHLWTFVSHESSFDL
jgi:hypothetical protein